MAFASAAASRCVRVGGGIDMPGRRMPVSSRLAPVCLAPAEIPNFLRKGFASSELSPCISSSHPLKPFALSGLLAEGALFAIAGKSFRRTLDTLHRLNHV